VTGRSLTLPATLVALRDIEGWLHDVLDAPLGNAATWMLPRVELAAQEVCVNAITHGKLTADQELTLDAELVSGASEPFLCLVIGAGGPPFDPSEIADPDPLAPQVHGYGTMIVRSLTRRFSVDRIGDTNRATLEFSLVAPTRTTGNTSVPDQPHPMSEETTE
jgi:anti-sigma regulatory factor (Ser/Thr protein kinase)